jgi:AcrR family transcriptional regulator
VRAVAEMTSAPRRGRGRPARYSLEELLAVVVAEFNARGYDATSMEDLARATGLTKSSVYHHVASKEELLRLAVSRALDALFAVLEEPASTSGSAVDRLEHVVRRSVDGLSAGRWSAAASSTGDCPAWSRTRSTPATSAATSTRDW